MTVSKQKQIFGDDDLPSSSCPLCTHSRAASATTHEIKKINERQMYTAVGSNQSDAANRFDQPQIAEHAHNRKIRHTIHDKILYTYCTLLYSTNRHHVKAVRNVVRKTSCLRVLPAPAIKPHIKTPPHGSAPTITHPHAAKADCQARIYVAPPPTHTEPNRTAIYSKDTTVKPWDVMQAATRQRPGTPAIDTQTTSKL